MKNRLKVPSLSRPTERARVSNEWHASIQIRAPNTPYNTKDGMLASRSELQRLCDDTVKLCGQPEAFASARRDGGREIMGKTFDWSY